MINSLSEVIERFNCYVRTITDLLEEQDPVRAKNYLLPVTQRGVETLAAIRDTTTWAHYVVDDRLRNGVTLVTPKGRSVTSFWEYLPETDEFTIKFTASNAKEEKPCPTCR